MLYLANFMISKLKYFVQNKYLSSVSNNSIRTPFVDVVIKSLLQTLASICPFITEKDKILMELLFCSGIVSITDWKYTKSVGIKIPFLISSKLKKFTKIFNNFQNSFSAKQSWALCQTKIFAN